MICGLQIADLEITMRALRTAPVPVRAQTLAQIVSAAQTAHLCHRVTGRAHPRYGTGSLMAAAACWPMAARSPVLGRDDLACLARLADHLAQTAIWPGMPD